MSESLKFGPKWLRNTIATSPTKQDEIISRPILSECRFSREEMLSFCESSEFKEQTYATYPKMFNNQWQTPLAFQTEEREREKPMSANETTHGGRVFLNSNIKHGNQAWRKSFTNEEKISSENWRAQKDSGGTGVYYNNTYSKLQEHAWDIYISNLYFLKPIQDDQNRVKTSWRNPENTTENLLEQQKSPPLKTSDVSPATTSSTKSPPFISPMNKEFIEYHQQSQDDLKNYLMENPNCMMPPQQQPLAIGSKKDGMSVARQLFESEQSNIGKSSFSSNRSKVSDKESGQKVDLKKFEIDLVKNLTDLVHSSESDFNKIANSNKLLSQSAFPPLPPINANVSIQLANANTAASNSFDRPPIYWFYIDPHGKVKKLFILLIFI